MERAFHRFLTTNPPSFPIPELEREETYLLMDALWFGKQYCLMLYRHSREKYLLHASFLKREYGSQIARDLRILAKRYRFSGVVSDGGTGIGKAVFMVFGNIPHQICLVHLHRDIINAIGRFPKDERVKELKKLADHVFLIESKEALGWWRGKFLKWYEKNRDFLREYRSDDEGHWWYIHKGVRKAVKILVSLPDTSFKFLDHPLIPKSTNELEGSISVLSQKKALHRGLKRERVQPFLRWFIYFYNKNLLSQRKS